MATIFKQQFALCWQSIFGLMGVCGIALIALVAPTSIHASERLDVVALVTDSIDQTRGLSSYAEMSMLIKRPSWQRHSARSLARSRSRKPHAAEGTPRSTPCRAVPKAQIGCRAQSISSAPDVRTDGRGMVRRSPKSSPSPRNPRAHDRSA